MIKGRINEIDEYEFISNAIKTLYNNDSEVTKELISGLTLPTQSQLKDIMKSKRVIIQVEEKEQKVIRKILKAKK